MDATPKLERNHAKGEAATSDAEVQVIVRIEAGASFVQRWTIVRCCLGLDVEVLGDDRRH